VVKSVKSWLMMRPPDDGDTERATKFGAGAVAERKRQGAEQRGHGGP